MVSIRNVSFRFEGSPNKALDDVSWEIRRGQYACLIGTNGSGKTTLLKHLNGLLIPLAGEVIVGGLCASDRKNFREIRRRVGMIFQNPDAQIIGVTVEEDVVFGPENLALPSAEIQARVTAVLTKLGIVHLRRRETHGLSGGEKRLVALAGVLAMAPDVIALDEPTAYLDAQSGDTVRAALRSLNQEGVTIIHITHDWQEAMGADNLAILHEGRMLTVGSPATILADENFIAKSGMRLPPLSALFSRLALHGFPVPSLVLGVNEAFEALRLVFDKGGDCNGQSE